MITIIQQHFKTTVRPMLSCLVNYLDVDCPGGLGVNVDS
jgi:hypothetical protein